MTIDDEQYIVLGNNRVLAAMKLGITDQLSFEEVQLPFKNFGTEEEVIQSWSERFGY